MVLVNLKKYYFSNNEFKKMLEIFKFYKINKTIKINESFNYI